MKQSRIAALTVAVSLAAPLPPAAQTTPEDDGIDLLEEGARLMMRGLMREMAPALDEFEGIAREVAPMLEDFRTDMGPALRGLIAAMDDIRHYEAPQVLDNGDILIRRRPDAPRYAGAAEPEIEL